MAALPAQTSLLRKIIFGVALFGVLVVAHLALQKATGFANGCSGIASVGDASTMMGETNGCETVTSSVYADFLGVSNILWGLLFYGLMAGLRVGYVATANDTLRKAAFGLASVGLLYTGYLVYLQVAEIGAFCVLCMTSAATVATLFGLHLWEHRQVGVVSDGAAGDSARRRLATPQTSWAKPYGAIAGAFLVFLLADIAIARSAQADLPVEAKPNLADLGAQARAEAQARAMSDDAACDYKQGVEPLADGAFTDGPYRGSADAPVVAIEVFDPNCGHCKNLAEVMDPVAAARPDDVRVHYVPYPIQPNSVGQIVALKLAQREGKFIPLMDEMFARQDNTWGMTIDELLETVEAVGMNPTAVRAALENTAVLQPILNQIQLESNAITEAFKDADGSMSTPRLAFNGRQVSGSFAAYTPRCLNEYIDDAKGS